jgi:FkbM family methyltransferase
LKIQVRNISFFVDDTFNPEYWRYFRSGKWEPDTFDIIDAFISSNNCVVDLGCWIGPLTLYVAGKGAYVHAVDPDPEAYQLLIKNLDLNPSFVERIKPHKVAISKKNGHAVLHAREHYGKSSSSLLLRTRDRISTIKSKTYSLKTFLEVNAIEKIDFLKIDIEGGEFEIVDQLLELKKKRKFKNLLLSLHYDHLNESIYQNKVRFKFLSLLMMKIERITGKYLFKQEILRHLTNISKLGKKFKYVYNTKGDQLQSIENLPKYLLDHKIDLFLTDEEWNKHEITKPKLH